MLEALDSAGHLHDKPAPPVHFSYSRKEHGALQRLVIRAIERLTGQPRLERLYRAWAENPHPHVTSPPHPDTVLPMTLKVIGTGFGRTGTDSMREALDMLGFGPCHHMFEVNSNEEQKRLWRAFVQGTATGWDQLFAGYASCVDWPSAHYWSELIRAYPEARVILTWRSPESWWASFEKTIVQGIRQATDPASVGLTLVRDQVFGGKPDDRVNAIAVYEANVKAVRATVPKERLLVHELGDGWEPLCAHLRVAIPSQPYPSRNTASEFKDTQLKDMPAKP